MSDLRVSSNFPALASRAGFKSDLPPPLIVSVRQTAQLLSLSERTVWTMIRNRVLPVVHVGARVLIVYSELVSFIEQNTVQDGELVRPDRSKPLSDLNRSRRSVTKTREGV